MLKLLHTADWQIGKPFGQFEPDEASLLSEARIQTVERLARIATEHEVDAVLVAGDVFDAQTVADKTLYRLFNALAAYQGPWIMIPGNHDAALAESVWTRAKRMGALPDNLYSCVTAEPLHLESLKLTLLPAPLTQRHTYQDLSVWFDHADSPEGFYRIGIAHGSVQGILDDDIDSPNPIAANRATSARLDYLALGDWHGMKQIDEHTWYSGTPEPDRFKSNDAGYALLVEISTPSAKPNIARVPMAYYRWQQHSHAIHVDSDVDVLAQWINQLDTHDVIDLHLEGSVTLSTHQRLTRVLGQAQGRTRVFNTDSSALRISPSDEDIEALAADGYIGEVITELRNEQQQEGHVARDALVILADLLNTHSEEEQRP